MSTPVKLRQAFDEGRLAADHVDLQYRFYDDDTKVAFPEVRKFAAHMRDRGIPNHWIAYADTWDVSCYEDFSRAHAGRETAISDMVGAQNHELVFQKNEMGAFDMRDAPLLLHLRDQGIDTIFVTGVRYFACGQETIIGAVEKNKTVYVIVDATNCPQTYFERWRNRLLRNANLRERESQLAMITMNEALQVLDAPAGTTHFSPFALMP